jgi:LysM repeat protein
MSTPKPKKKGIPLLSNLLSSDRRRHQVAMITEEGEWNKHESNSGMARVFVVMLLVHVVLIGSIIVYDFVGTDESAAAPAPTVAKALTPEARELPAPPLPEPVATPIQETSEVASSPSSEVAVALEIYEVKTGDSLPKIAAAKGVALEDLIELNKLDEGNTEITAFTRLKIPANKVAAPARVEAIKDFPVAQTEVPAASAVIPLEETPPAPVSNEEALPAVVPLTNTTIDTAPPSLAPATTPAADAPPAMVPVSNPPTPAVATPTKPKPVAPPSQIVNKPTPTSAPKAEPTKSTTKVASSSSKSHTMGKGDTLYSLSRKYGISVTALQKANNITNPNAIREGTKLVIPGK